MRIALMLIYIAIALPVTAKLMFGMENTSC